jgi:hypothetical protein
VSVLTSDRRARRRKRRRRGRVIALVVAALLLLTLVFLVGLALGRALEEGPEPEGTVTQVRTLQPVPLPPATRTVTVTGP